MINPIVQALEGGLRPFLDSHPEITAAYVFSSPAGGGAAQAGSADIAILCAWDCDERFYDELRSELCEELRSLLKREDLDVLILNGVSSSELKFRIVQDGEVFFDRCPDLAEYELRVKNEYYDHMATLRSVGFADGEE